MGSSPLNPSGSHFSQREWGLQQWGEVQPLCLHLCDQKQQSVISGQSLNIWWIVLFAHLAPVSCVQDAPETPAQLPATGLGVGDGQLLQRYDLKLTNMNHSLCSLLSKPSPGSCKRSADSSILKQLQQTGSASAAVVQVGRQMLPILPYSQNPLLPDSFVYILKSTCHVP